ncbi:MAG: protein-L-isoaspartate O-methyltransferase [Proteobacteria bacterium]|nr:protein-L-isoaspartate O-methyltransferase [Pseudomonadota bacterium]
MADTALQRKNMVESQIRPSDITDRRITAAMMAVPRERFLPDGLASLAYSDESLVVAPGRELLPPRVIAKLIQLAEFDGADTVLVISEAGYAAALVAQFTGKAVALLPDEESATRARDAFSALGLTNAVAVSGPAASGWTADAPYDVVLIEGGIERIPDGIKTQVRQNGRIVAIATDASIGHAVIFHKRSDMFSRRDDFQAAALPLAGFREPRPAFVF